MNPLLLTVALIGTPFAGAALIALLKSGGRAPRTAAQLALLAAAITTALAVLLIVSGQTYILLIDWIAPAGIGVGVQVDGLSLLFVALISAVSFLSLLYSQHYIRHEIEEKEITNSEFAYYGYMLLFTGSMLGMVLSPDLIQLYIFWELTGIASFLLIGLNWTDADSRKGAVKALLITALGGLAMLVGFILIGSSVGTFSLAEVIERFPALRASPVFAVALVLILTGAATKSAQFPFHVWLPDAMVAPSPVSAFLHSAALVAAGVYLLARLHPVFVDAPLWQWLVTGIGTASMLAGGVLALRATEFKRLLAYSTISQYGFIFALLGYGGAGAVAAAMFNFLNHGLIKAGLFLAAGAVTYATGTTMLGEAGPVWSRLRVLFLSSAVLALSLGGLPAFAGFWMKEAFIAETINTHNLLLVVLAVVGGALTLTYMLRFIFGAFVEGERDPRHIERPAATMLIAPALLALLTIAYGLYPSLLETTLVEPAAAAIAGRPVDLTLSLHLDLKLLLSLLALALGGLIFAYRETWSEPVRAVGRRISLDDAYRVSATGLARAGGFVLRLQNGQLPVYIVVVMLGLLGLVLMSIRPILMGRDFPLLGGDLQSLPRFTPYQVPADWGMVLVLVMIGVGTVLTFILARHVHVILALSAVGYLIAGFFALEYAPDVGLVQVHVETLVTVLFVIALVLIPRDIRQKLVLGVRARISGWKLMLAATIGIGSAWFSWLAIEHAPTDPLGPWFNENAYEATHAADVVAAILVDYRALDTLGEITVFAIATAGVFALIQLVRKEMP